MKKILSPFDGAVIKQVALVSEEDAFAMVRRSKYIFSEQASELPMRERIKILKNLAKAVEQCSEEFSMLIAREGGKPLMHAKVEVARAREGIELAIAALGSVMKGEEIPMNLNLATKDRRAYTRIEPRGVVLAISAFNHPLNLIVHQVVPAIAVGCPVIIKPSLETPLCCIKFCDLLKESGLPQDWCQVLICDDTITQKLAESCDIQFLSFIGSAEVGWMLKSRLSPGVHCALEHGGVAPVIVDKNINHEVVAKALSFGGYYHAGQVCVSVQRVFIPAKEIDRFIPCFQSEVERLVVGDPCEPLTEVGPLINERAINRISDWVSKAIEAGAQLICGGKKISTSLYAPTILLNPPLDLEVSKSEIFGPVVCLYSYENIEQAISMANNVDYAFQASIFSQNPSTIENLVDKLDAAAVMINDHTAFRCDWMPFGGRRHSGYGVGGIEYSMRELVQHKLVVTNYSH